eukprot:14878981-Alexandrium_andersonii.AAC.3
MQCTSFASTRCASTKHTRDAQNNHMRRSKHAQVRCTSTKHTRVAPLLVRPSSVLCLDVPGRKARKLRAR